MVQPAQLLLELLVPLLARPPRLDRGGELLERRVGGQVRKVVLALARGSVLAHQPDFVPGQRPASRSAPDACAAARCGPRASAARPRAGSQVCETLPTGLRP